MADFATSHMLVKATERIGKCFTDWRAIYGSEDLGGLRFGEGPATDIVFNGRFYEPCAGDSKAWIAFEALPGSAYLDAIDSPGSKQ